MNFTQQPRRSPRIAAKNTPVLPAALTAPTVPELPVAAKKAIMTLNPLMNSLNGIYDKNKRAEIICNVFTYLINDPYILAAYPNFRNITIDKAINAIQSVFEHKIIHLENRETLVHTATEILRIISAIERHPDYVVV